MNDVIANERPASAERSNLTLLTHALYALHTLSWFSAGIFSVIAIIVNYVKRPDLPDAFFRSHFRWQSRSFWFTLLWLVLALPLWILVIPGWIAYTVIGFWYLYRFIRGWWSFADGRPMPMPVDA
jgi:uncharacterized membrane protein